MGTPKPLKWRVFERDRFTCRYCGATGVPLEADHVFPESKGGPTVYNNLVAACEKCNREKSNKLGIYPLPVDYLERLSYANRVIAWHEEQQEKERQAAIEVWKAETTAKVETIMRERLRKLEQWRRRQALYFRLIRLLPRLCILFWIIGSIMLFTGMFMQRADLLTVWLVTYILAAVSVFSYSPLLGWYNKSWEKIPLFLESD